MILATSAQWMNLLHGVEDCNGYSPELFTLETFVMNILETLLNKQVIVRSHMAGVYFGTLVDAQLCDARSPHALLRNVRKIWSWDGANCLSDIALGGVQKPSRIAPPLEWSVIFDVIEILPLSDAAARNLYAQPFWSLLPSDASHSKVRHVDSSMGVLP